MIIIMLHCGLYKALIRWRIFFFGNMTFWECEILCPQEINILTFRKPRIC